MGQMNASRADVSHSECHTAGELALNIEIPLHFVAARRIGFNARGLERAQAKQIKSPVRKAGRRRIGYRALPIEWSSSWEQIDKQIRQGNDIEHSYAPAYRGLAILERIP